MSKRFGDSKGFRIKVDVLTIALSSPLLVGIYEDGKLIKSYSSSEHTSDVLPDIFFDILNNFEIDNLFYAKGPGSFMAIKVAYIFLKTLCISLDVNLYASSGFFFNNNSPIKALKKVYFVEENGKIVTKIFKDDIEQKFQLPKTLNKSKFSIKSEPLYILPAV